MENRTLSHDEARRFYDRFGARQDAQAFYEDAAVQDLLAHTEWAEVGRLLEFGCGTGRIAAMLLREHLPPSAHYLGVDISSTMITLARQRLQPFNPRAEVGQVSGTPDLPGAAESADCVFSCYVVDLLSPQDIDRFVSEAYRVLRPGGQLALVSLTHGCTLGSRAFERVWTALHRWRPALVGGCRPIALRPFLDAQRWSIRYDAVTLRFGVASEVVVATAHQQA